MGARRGWKRLFSLLAAVVAGVVVIFAPVLAYSLTEDIPENQRIDITYSSMYGQGYSEVQGTVDELHIKYTGEEVRPGAVLTKYNSDHSYVTLEEGKDYVISGYTNNVGPGVASVEVTGIGQYKGTASYPFTIYQWDRLGGATAYDTMQQIVEADDVFQDGRGGYVVVATGDGYWDALCASGVAGVYDAPIITTPTGYLCWQAQEEIERLKPEHIIVMGGPAAVSDKTLQSLGDLCSDVERYYGDTARSTARQAYEKASGWADECFVVSGNGYWDALSVASISYAHKEPIFLCNGDNKLDPETLAVVSKFGKINIIGGPAAVSSEVEEQLKSAGAGDKVMRYAGKNACETCFQVVFGLADIDGFSHLCVATSGGYWDALAGAPLAAKENSYLCIIPTGGLDNAEWMENVPWNLCGQYSNSIDENWTYIHGHVLGGEAAVSAETMDYLWNMYEMAKGL